LQSFPQAYRIPLSTPEVPGNFARQYRIFTQSAEVIGLKTGTLEMAYGLHLHRRGARAEDPFRGLRAGPVRLSPTFFHSPRFRRSRAFPHFRRPPKNTPNVPNRRRCVATPSHLRICVEPPRPQEFAEGMARLREQMPDDKMDEGTYFQGRVT
jgi:hypothetical protein